MAKIGGDFNLIRELALTDFRLKYNNSILGYFWSLLNPLLLFGTLYIIFSIFMRFNIENYALYLLLGIIVWNYFSEATNNAMDSIINKSSILKKIYFPRYIIVLSSNITTFIGFLLNLVVFFVFFIISGLSFKFTIILLPVYIALLFFLTYGISLILSSLYVRFRDLSHIWRVLLQIGFWATPIIYSISIIPQNYQKLFLLNPMALLITNFRNSVIYDSFPGLSLISLILLCLLIFLLGFYIFNKLADYFAEWV
ncbi:MAG: ABC transporter permease [archaeon]